MRYRWWPTMKPCPECDGRGKVQYRFTRGYLPCGNCDATGLKTMWPDQKRVKAPNVFLCRWSKKTGETLTVIWESSIEYVDMDGHCTTYCPNPAKTGTNNVNHGAGSR